MARIGPDRFVCDRDPHGYSTLVSAIVSPRTLEGQGSEFHRQHHAGLFDAPCRNLPATKAVLMRHFDQAVTTPGLRLADVEEIVGPRAVIACGPPLLHKFPDADDLLRPERGLHLC